MGSKVQTQGSVVTDGGYINVGWMGFTRRDVIRTVLADYVLARDPGKWGCALTDAQFWRILKRRQGWSVRKIELRIIRR